MDIPKKSAQLFGISTGLIIIVFIIKSIDDYFLNLYYIFINFVLFILIVIAFIFWMKAIYFWTDDKQIMKKKIKDDPVSFKQIYGKNKYILTSRKSLRSKIISVSLYVVILFIYIFTKKKKIYNKNTLGGALTKSIVSLLFVFAILFSIDAYVKQKQFMKTIQVGKERKKKFGPFGIFTKTMTKVPRKYIQKN